GHPAATAQTRRQHLPADRDRSGAASLRTSSLPPKRGAAEAAPLSHYMGQSPPPAAGAAGPYAAPVMTATAFARRFAQVMKRSARIATQLRCHRLKFGVSPPFMSSVASRLA